MRSTSVSFPAPRPRFLRDRFAGSENSAAPAPYVKVPLMVMLPLGPEIVELYLEKLINRWLHRILTDVYIPLRIVNDLITRISGKENRNGRIRQVRSSPTVISKSKRHVNHRTNLQKKRIHIP